MQHSTISDFKQEEGGPTHGHQKANTKYLIDFIIENMASCKFSDQENVSLLSEITFGTC